MYNPSNTFSFKKILHSNFSENMEVSMPCAHKQRLIKLLLKCFEALLAPAFINIPTFCLCNIPHISKFCLTWWGTHRSGDILPKILGLVLMPSISFSHPSPPFLCSSSFCSTHKTIPHVGRMLKKITRGIGCSIGSSIPFTWTSWYF